MSAEIRVPELGESVTEATVGEWRKKEGETVAADEVVAELETDKVTVEATAPQAGVLSKIHVGEGETVEVGALLAEIGGDGSSAKASPPPAAKSAASNGASDGGAAMDVAVPELGESVTEATVGAIHKKPGDPVAADEAIMELETDKVTVEATAAQGGVIADITVAEGDVVAVGAVVAKVTAGGTASVGASADAAKPSSQAPSRPSSPAAQPGPGARRTAEVMGVDIAAVQGSGKGGRATKGDVIAAAKSPSARPAPSAPGAPRDLGPREERVRMSRLRQTIARRLKEAQDTAAMLTTFNEVDMTAVIGARKKYKDLFEKKHGVKLGFMSFFVKACVQALKDVPDVNAEIDGQDVIYKNHYDVGVAVGTERGLVVPVVRDADLKTMGGVEREIGELAKKARDGKLSLEDMQGGTFTITNGGVYGSLMSTPILNQPQSGILGMHKIQERPMAVNGEVKIRPMMYLALSYDHRIVDGQGAVTFLVRVKECIEDPERLMLDL